MATNAGFRPEELNRRAFQRTAALTIDKQAEAIGKTREFMADLSGRLDRAELAVSALEQRQRSFEQLPFLSRLGALEQRQRSFEQLPFLSRLWWLLRGR